MKPAQRLLGRQLRRHFGEAAEVPESLRGFVADVERAYEEAATDRQLLERSLDLVSQELSERSEELALAFAAANLGVWSWDPNADRAKWFTLDTESQPARRSGSAEDFLASIAEEDRARVRDELSRALSSGVELRIEFRAQIDGTTVRWWSARGRRTRDGTRMVGVTLDVTAQVRAREEEARRRAAQERQSRCLTELALYAGEAQGGDIRTALAHMTRQVARVLNVERVGVWEHGDDRLQALDVFERATGAHVSGGQAAAGEYPVCFARLRSERVVVADESVTCSAVRAIWGAQPASPGCVMVASVRRGGQLLGVLGVENLGPRLWTQEEQSFVASVADLVALLFEMARRREAEEALERQRAFLRQIIDQAPNFIFVKDREGRYTLVNEAMAEGYGKSVESLVGHTAAEARPDLEQAQRYAEGDTFVFDTRSEYEVKEERFVDHLGRERWLHVVKRPIVDTSGSVTHVLGVATDITERRAAERKRAELEESLRQAQKLEAIGMLAGGVAHDFNNLLTPILVNAEIALGENPPSQLVRDLLAEVQEAAERARDLTSQLLAFGRKQVLELRDVDINEEVRLTARLIRRTLSENIRCEVDLGEVGSVRADLTQIHQALLNLAINARDAMPDGGVLTIFTRSERTGEDGRETCVLGVTDTGVGMDEHTRAQIFEPFFSTKGVGRGTGLGLSTVYGIVQQHGGSISVVSEVGKGTTFEIRLPSTSAAPASKRQPVGQGSLRPGAGTILVVEDEPSVRRVVDRVLRRRGYRVLVAPDPEEALELAKRHSDVIDLLLTDVMMPKMNGKELHERLEAEGHAPPVVYMSGHSHDVLAPRGVLQDKVHFLRKPFSPTQLTDAVRKALRKGA